MVVLTVNFIINPLIVNIMSVRDYAVQDIQDELAKSGKCFIAFHNELNPVMGRLVSSQIEAQKKLSGLFEPHSKANAQLVASCFFCKDTGKITFENYSHYYEKV